MSKYNHHFNSHFSSCRLLGIGHDPHRNREVQFRALPGEFDVIGITDGTDAWIAPISSPFLSHIRKVLEAIRNGEDPRPITTGRRRAAIEEPEPEIKPRRRVVIEEEQPQPRRRAHVHS